MYKTFSTRLVPLKTAGSISHPCIVHSARIFVTVFHPDIAAIDSTGHGKGS